MADLVEWLQALGLERHAATFAANDIDRATLPLLNDADLAGLGLSLGHRRRLLHALAQPEPPAATETGERRHLTVLFCDMVGFSELASRIDPESLQAVIQHYEDTCAAAVERYAGHVFQRLGDGIVAFFGFPVAHEDEAERAVRAGFDILAALAGDDVPDAGHIAVRIGIACGMVVVQSPETGAIGDTAIIAARLQAIAEPDSILVSGRIHRLTGDCVSYQDCGYQALKGIAAPIPTFRALALRRAENRFDQRQQAPLTPFVGRKAQLARSRTAWQAARAGRGQVIGIRGEAGIGKSRLARQIVGEARMTGASWSLEAQCSPFHSRSGLQPIVETLGRRIFGAAPPASDAAGWAQLRDVLATTGMDAAEALPLLASQFSIEPPAGTEPLSITAARARTMTRHYLVELLVEQARRGPGVLLIEDLHWADPSARELIDALVERVRDQPILLLLTCRPDHDALPASAGHVTTINLGRLRGAAASELVRHVLAGAVLPADTLGKVVDKTDGVPLYIEEFARAVVEARVADPTGVGTVTIPDTLRDSLAGRLDLLGHAKAVAQVAAILGRDFSHELLAAIWPGPAEALESGLARLGTAGLIHPAGDGQRRHYAFRHALIQDAAYESQLISRRIREHKRIAAIIENQFPAMAMAHPEIVAHHYSCGGDMGSAAGFWLHAGQQSLRRNAHLEAIDHLEQALQAVQAAPGLPDRQRTELDIRMTLGTALVVAKGYAAAEVGDAWGQAHALCAGLGHVGAEVRALFGLWMFRTVGADHAGALALSHTLLALAAAESSPDIFIVGHQAMAMSRFFIGELAEAEASCHALLALYDRDRHAGQRFEYGQDPAAIANALLGWLLWFRGDEAGAAAATAAAVDGARRLDHPFTHAYALAYAGWLQLYRGDAAAVAAITAQLVPLCTESRIPLFLGNGIMLLGWARCEQGDAGGPAELARGLDLYRATGSRCFLPYRMALLAEALSRRGDHAAATAMIDEALAAMAATGENWSRPELHRLHGSILARAGAAPARVATAYEAARASAHAMGCRDWERRAAAALAAGAAAAGPAPQPLPHTLH